MFILLDVIFAPLTIVASIYLKLIRRYNVGLFKSRSSISKRIFELIGVFPIINHYYEPYVGKNRPSKPRFLTGLFFSENEQLQFLKNFNYQDELLALSRKPHNRLVYSFSRGPFLSGDAEVLYSMIRLNLPRKVIEIGCGHSSMLIQHAILKNSELDNEYDCEHICIEPYEAPYLKELNVEFVKKSVTEVNLDVFKSLNQGDILFIDSSHIIRPDGDVLYEYLTILPILKPGVFVHIHDIFTPNHYLSEWNVKGVNFWNEQYLLEAFLTCNSEFKIILALNYLKNNYFSDIKRVCPLLDESREPGSIWLKRV